MSGFLPFYLSFFLEVVTGCKGRNKKMEAGGEKQMVAQESLLFEKIFNKVLCNTRYLAYLCPITQIINKK